MDLFPKVLKLYCFIEKEEISLSIKASDNHVITYWMSQVSFEKMIKDSFTNDGYSEDKFFVFVKSNYVRFSKSIQGMATHFRLQIHDWQQLIDLYKTKKSHHHEGVFSCEV